MLGYDFYRQDTVAVARALLGCHLVCYVGGTRVVGRISETEAYRSTDDPASHAYRGKTVRNAPMFGPVGHLYVYMIYGMHFCCNIVAKKDDQAAGAVLLRSIEPLEGVAMLRAQRYPIKPGRDKNLANGPGKLCQAFAITKEHNGISVVEDVLCTIQPGSTDGTRRICTSVRVGITKGVDKLWRFSLI